MSEPIAPSPAPVGIFLATLTLGNPWAPRSADVLAAMDAAADAGCQHVGVSLPAVGALRAAGLDPAAELRDRGLGAACLEAMFRWSGGVDTAGAEAAEFAAVARSIGTERIIAVELARGDVAALAPSLRAAHDTAAADGCELVIEFLPWSTIGTLRDAWELVEPLERASLMIDTWHWARQPGGPDHELLGAIPGQRISVVQLSDTMPAVAAVAAVAGNDPGGVVTGGDIATVPVEADLMTEAMTRRSDPGEGDAGIAGFLATLRHTGASPMYLAEVFNPARLAIDGPHRRAATTIAACTHILRAGSTPDP